MMANLDGAPDIGTLGGTMQDEYGVNNSYYGEISPEQSYANEQVNSDPWGYDFSAADFYSPGQFTLSNLWGSQPMTGLPTTSGPDAGNADTYGFSDFFESPFGKVARMALNATPLGKVANVAYGVSKGRDPVSAGLGMLPGLGGRAVQLGYDASRGRNVAPQLGGTLGSVFGGMAGGPIGSMIGGQAGAYMGNQVSRGGRAGTAQASNANPQSNDGGNGFNVENLAGGLASLYAASQANKGLSGAGANNDAVSGQISQLSNMFGPNSPYAQQLRQTLERKDAAAGRRSQYGPREVQLQAMLADKAAGTADTIGRLATSNQNNQMALRNQKNQTRGQQLALLMNLGKSTGAFQGLQSMFSGGGGGSPVEDYPVYDTEDYGGGV